MLLRPSVEEARIMLFGNTRIAINASPSSANRERQCGGRCVVRYSAQSSLLFQRVLHQARPSGRTSDGPAASRHGHSKYVGLGRKFELNREYKFHIAVDSENAAPLSVVLTVSLGSKVDELAVQAVEAREITVPLSTPTDQAQAYASI